MHSTPKGFAIAVNTGFRDSYLCVKRLYNMKCCAIILQHVL